MTNYTIYRSTRSGSGYALIQTVSSSTLNFKDTSINNDQTYYYVVKANNAVGASIYSNEVNGQSTAPVLTSSKKTQTFSPGFELYTVIALLGSLTIYKRRRKISE